MISAGFKWTLVALAVAAGGGALIGLRLDNARLRRQIAAQERANADASRLRAENQRTQALLAQIRASEAGGRRAVDEEVARLRVEVRELEQRAEQNRAQRLARESADRAAVVTNRDPRAGMMAIEHFANVGQATPAAAWQTLTWAIVNRREDVFAGIFVVSPEGRARAEQLIGDMPEAERAHWTPEKIGRQFFTGALGQTRAMEITVESLQDPERATLRVRVQGKGDAMFEQPMQRGPAGWQVVIGEQPITAVERRLRLIAERAAK